MLPFLYERGKDDSRNANCGRCFGSCGRLYHISGADAQKINRTTCLPHGSG